MVEIRESRMGVEPSPSPPPAAPSPGRSDTSRRKTGVAILSVCSNTVLILLKIAVGLLIGSVAVLSEAIHSAVDLMAALIALFAVRKASEAADEPEGYIYSDSRRQSG